MNKKSIKKIIAAFLICCMGMVGVWTDEAEAGTYELEYSVYNPHGSRIFYKPADAEFLAVRINVTLKGGASYRTTRVLADGVDVGTLYPPPHVSYTESFISNTIVIPAGTQQVVISPYDGGNIISSPYYGSWGTASAIITYSRASGISELNEIKNSISTVSTKLDNMDTKVTSTQTTANNVLTQINNTTYGLSALNTKINNINTKIESLSTPVITKVSTVNGATASTTGVSPTIVITASGADMFDLGRDGTWVGGFPLNSGGSISIAPGINNIQIRAYDSTIPEDKRKYGYGNILIFGL